jgi:hypothetical protein
MVYQGEFRNGKKDGWGRLETFKNNFSLSSYNVSEVSITPRLYERSIKEVIAKVKKDVLAEIHKLKRKAEKLCYHNSTDEIWQSISEISGPMKDQFDDFDLWHDSEVQEMWEKGPSTGYMRKYLGEFKNDMKSGFGKVWYPNGDVYAGQFKSDKRSGFGMYLYCEQVPALGYLGYHQDDLYHGIGKISFENSSHYLGAFSFGKMKADSGRFEFENGDVYEGPIQNSKKS